MHVPQEPELFNLLYFFKPEDRQLIKELSKEGKGRPKEVAFLLNEGANPNAVTKDGLNMLHLAMKNRHFESIRFHIFIIYIF